jgi:hypothetical protein
VSRPASSPERLQGRLAVDRADEVAVDLADEDHPDDLQGLGIGHPEAVAKLRLLADPAHHRIDLRPAAMDEHAAHADAPQQKHVLRERPVERLVDRRAAQLHHHRAAVEALDVGQGLDEDRRGFGRAPHEVLEFSLM